MDLSLAETRQISQEAYVFFRSMVNQYKLKKQTQVFQNRIVVTTDSSTSHVPFPYKCRDQVYGNAFLSLFTEPLVLGVPQIPADLFFSTMCCDQYGNNFAYFGSITTGNEAADYLIAGSNWQGTVPDSIDKAVISEGNYVTMILRLEVTNPEDASEEKEMADILRSCTLLPLSAYTQEQAPSQIDPPELPAFKEDALYKSSYFKYVNAFSFGLKIHPTEEKLYARFARIGVYPGAPFPPIWMDDAHVEAIAQGVWAGRNEVEAEFERQSTVNIIGGWLYTCGIKPPLIGSREVMKDRYLARAGMARSTFKWGNDIQQAIYLQTYDDCKGNPLTGGNEYLLRWGGNELPPVKAFWSVTLYDQEGLYVPNEINRCNISSNTPDLSYLPDNSLVIYIQDSNPGDDKTTNWLPCPATGNFQLFLRCYWPKDIFFHGNYSPPLPIMSCQLETQ